jgi:excisionase family DNA binding protein
MSLEVEYLSPSQAAARVGVSHQTIVAWMDAGRLRGLRTPIGRLIEKQDAERVAQERRERPSGDAA